MTAEGQAYSLDVGLDVSELVGDLTGTIQWGDGTSSSATIASKPAAGSLKVRIDYSLDNAGFFQAASRRALLQTVLDSIATRFSDTLTAIQPSGSDVWEARFKDPNTGLDIKRPNLTIAANEILVYVGARTIVSGETAVGDRGGYWVSSTKQQFRDAVSTRGQAGAAASPPTDVGPWGGSISFNASANWYFGTSASGIGSNQSDFVSVVAHEFMHVLGFGTCDSWTNKIVNSKFAGAAASAEYGSAVPLADAKHFSDSITYQGRRPLMSPSLGGGERSMTSRLDLSAMRDIGWQLITPTARVTGSKVFGDNGTFAAAIVLQGSQIGTKSSPVSIPITNALPTFDSRGNATATAGYAFTLNRIGVFSDPGFGSPLATPPRTESFTYRIQWGDNNSQTGDAVVESLGSATAVTRGYFNGTHTYANPGTYTVTLTVTDDDGGSAQQQFQMAVSEQPQLVVTIDKSSFSEAAGAGVAVLAIARPAAFAGSAVIVQLASSDTSEASLPTSVTLLEGVTSTTVGVSAVDDALFDGTQTAVLSARATGFRNGQVTVTITDYQPISLAAENTQLHEDIPSQRSTRLTIGIRSPAPALGAVVSLTASPVGVLQFPPSVVIPAGASQVDVEVSAVDDLRPQRLRTVTLDASGENLVAKSMQFTVNDSDPFRWTNPSLRMDVDNNRSIDPLDVLIIIDEINRRGSRWLDPATDTAPPFYDTQPDGRIDPLDVLVVIDAINNR